MPDGDTDQEAVEVRRWGRPPHDAGTDARHHSDIGESLGILDGPAAAKLSGSRFSVGRGAGARLERALADFFLDLHTGEHGYTEYSVPFLVNRDTMTGTGQLPKFEDDLFRTQVGDRELFLIPTAEVPLTNLVAQQLLDARALPYAFTARTPCFRAEAGAYGRDTRGSCACTSSRRWSWSASAPPRTHRRSWSSWWGTPRSACAASNSPTAWSSCPRATSASRPG
ncbi:hypothetical protein SAV14893_014820 [Streptomyces avermitilis]|uniref:Seryl-tRNA(Ser/Sec) synthetase n=1 Tax=Streptomyces avermitilis TaxID=33903 RepID=A0A4D4LWA3_STRAX|nr:hypothetical protein SAV14893_014820 [Streptomyces avermitilis]